MGTAAIWCWVGPEVAISFASIPATLLIAMFYGDLAGNNAAIEYEERKEKEKQVFALKALLNQVELVQMIAKSNTGRISYRPRLYSFVELPTQAFETAFVSDKPLLSRQDELLEVVNDYLSKAYFINSKIRFLTRLETTGMPETMSAPQEIFHKVQENCEELADVLDKLENSLKAEIR
jgi:hypothetical protein